MQKQFNTKTNLVDDDCYKSSYEQQNEKIKNYHLEPTTNVNNMNNAQKLSVENPSMLFKDGFGSIGNGGMLVNNDTELKNNKKSLTHYGEKQMLNTRLFKSVPFKGRGVGNPNIEKSILEGVDTSSKRQCNALSEVSIPNVFLPLVPSLQENIQNIQHIIPEDNRSDWIRGGCPSRQMIRDQLNCKKCPKIYKTCKCLTG
jgi:hypothetical protein